jgi:catechol 2,3-dioxygenase-like lactoylglutathione lyase family enzyme
MNKRGLLSSRELVAFVATANPRVARDFYEKKLGLHLVYEDRFALVFDANGVTLRVIIVEKVAVAGYTVLGWLVPDVAEAARQLGKVGIELQRYPPMEQDELGIWTAPSGARVGWFRDPDGNTLSITEVSAG